MHLFWAIFTEKTKPQAVVVPAAGKPLDEPKRYWEIKLGWSEYRNSKWSAKKLSQDLVRSNILNPTIEDESQHAFKTRVDESTNDLIILCVKNINNGGVVGAFRVIGCDRRIITIKLSGDVTAPSKDVIDIISYSLLEPRRTRIVNTAFAETQGLDGDALYLIPGSEQTRV